VRRYFSTYAVAALSALVFLALANPSRGYEESPDRNGGTLSGKVRFSGSVPEPKIYKLKDFYNPQYCGSVSDGKGNRVVHEVRIGENGGLQDAVVYIKNIRSGKPFSFSGADVKARNCEFLVQGGTSSLSGVVVRNRELRLTNEDADPNDISFMLGVKHNPQGSEVSGGRDRLIFKQILSNKGQVMTKKISLENEKSHMKLECDIHDFMKVYFLPVESPYYVLTQEDGSFHIQDVPPGKHTVMAWHPILGIIEQEVEIGPNRKASTDFLFKK
jgi:hypothetical protein